MDTPDTNTPIFSIDINLLLFAYTKNIVAFFVMLVLTGMKYQITNIRTMFVV